MKTESKCTGEPMTEEQVRHAYEVLAMLLSETIGTTITVTGMRKREEGEPWHIEFEKC